MNVFLVTGGAGFIGSNICEKLLSERHRVSVIDNLSTGKEKNIKDFYNAIEFIKGDIRNTDDVKKAVQGVHYVVHLAALGSVPRSVEDPSTTHAFNVTGTLNILNASRDAGIRRVVYASSSSVYGDTPTLPKKEDMFPTPQSPYAVSKLSGEYYCKVFYKVYGLETVALRYFNVYGKRQDPLSQYAAVMPKFITALLTGERPTIFGDGEQSRDFTFVDDCNQANIKACFARGCEGGHFNVGSGSRVTINEVFVKIRHKAGSRVEPVYAESRKGDVKHSLADISKAKETLLYLPEFNIDRGMEKVVDWYAKNLQACSAES